MASKMAARWVSLQQSAFLPENISVILIVYCKSCNFGVYIMQGLGGGVKEYIAIVASQTSMLAAKSMPATIIFYYIFFIFVISKSH